MKKTEVDYLKLVEDIIKKEVDMRVGSIKTMNDSLNEPPRRRAARYLLK